MKFRLLSVLSVLGGILVLSGCSGAAVAKGGTTQPVITATLSTSQVASSTPEATETPGLSPTASLKATETQGLTPTASPKVTVPADWKQFTSKSLQVSLSYPGNWTVKETKSQVDLSSPQGVMILLAPVATGELTAEQYLNQNQLPNTRCTPSTNPHGLTVVTCFDTIARSYTAYVVVKTASGTTELLSLSLDQISKIQTFETIISSINSTSS